MEELIKILIIYVILMFIIKILGNANRRNNKDRIHRKVIHEKKINKNGQITNIKRTYINGEMDEEITETSDMFQGEVFGQSNLNQKINEMDEFLKSPKKNNNRHFYMYHDIEQEIIKVDHTFSKEVFLNNAKEVFKKYYNIITKGEVQELKKYLSDDFFDNVKNKIENNKKNNIELIAENILIYNAFLNEFSKSTENQVITVKVKAEMKLYEIDNNTRIVIKGNKFSKLKTNFEMQFIRKIKDVKCQSCGASININDLSICEYCNTPIKVENNEWKLNYIDILRD